MTTAKIRSLFRKVPAKVKKVTPEAVQISALEEIAEAIFATFPPKAPAPVPNPPRTPVPVPAMSMGIGNVDYLVPADADAGDLLDDATNWLDGAIGIVADLTTADRMQGGPGLLLILKAARAAVVGGHNRILRSRQ